MSLLPAPLPAKLRDPMVLVNPIYRCKRCGEGGSRVKGGGGAGAGVTEPVCLEVGARGGDNGVVVDDLANICCGN